MPAGIDSAGPGGVLRAQGLASVWGRVMRVWLDDDEPGEAMTMAALDRQLRRTELALIRFDRLGRFLPGATAQPADAET